MRYQLRPMLVVVAGLLLPAGSSADGLAAIRALIGEIKVRIEHKAEPAKSDDGTKPPRLADAWTFLAGGINPTVRYSRYLNRPPDFTGTHPSLVGSDMGIGLDGGPFGNWYRGNAIRVVLDGHDVFAERPASRAQVREAATGQLRLVWELDAGRQVTLSFTVPPDGRAVYIGVEVEPGTAALKQLAVRLTCYPGGFGPAYGLPSHRYARTATASGEVPSDFTPTAERPYPVVPIAGGDDWVFYGDRTTGNGGLGLLIGREGRVTGEIRLSNYGVTTALVYPEGTRRLRLGFFAYSIENEPAERQLLAELARERAALASSPFWKPEP